jgi:hypothetical protein
MLDRDTSHAAIESALGTVAAQAEPECQHPQAPPPHSPPTPLGASIPVALA